MTRDVPAPRQEELRRRLRRYAQTWRDNEFLDAMCDWAAAGRPFTGPQADAIEEALGYWQQRITGPSWDPGRPPPGYDALIWDLAGHFRAAQEAMGVPAPSRRQVHHELGRLIERDGWRERKSPWLDLHGTPGWYRMMTDVITVFITDEADLDRPFTTHQQLAQPGTVAGIAGKLIEDAMIARLDDRARTQPYISSPQQRAAVRAWLRER